MYVVVVVYIVVVSRWGNFGPEGGILSWDKFPPGDI